jgi:precorrin-2 dehydrogenase/sirohydrochlorin ferrochelatase
VIPLLHDFEGTRVLVAGGGRVGARRARTFAREAEVVVVSPTFADAGFGAAQRVRAAPAPEDAAGWVERVDPALVVAATDDPALNAAFAAAAREHGALVNRADRAGDRPVDDVAVPATVREGDVVVAVSSGGAAPALARHLRERVEREVAGAGEMAALAADLREEWTERYPENRRRAALRSVVRADEVWTALGEGSAKARQTAERVAAEELEQ